MVGGPERLTLTVKIAEWAAKIAKAGQDFWAPACGSGSYSLNYFGWDWSFSWS